MCGYALVFVYVDGPCVALLCVSLGLFNQLCVFMGEEIIKSVGKKNDGRQPGLNCICK